MGNDIVKKDDRAIIAKALANVHIKSRVKPESLGVDPKKAPYPYTQTEAYLKIRLLQFGKTYDEKDLLGNIERFMNLTSDKPFYPVFFYPVFFTPVVAKKIIENEKKFSRYFVCYNALRATHNLSYKVLNLMRQTMQIKGTTSDRRLFARMFDKAFKDFPTMDAFIKLMNLDGGHYHDQEKSYQKKVASTNLFLFGNTSKHEENSIMYMGSGWNAGFEDSILKCIFYNLGFKKKKDLVDERIKKYKNLYRKYEALWREVTIQQVFLSPDAFSRNVYLSYPFGVFLDLQTSESSLSF